MKDWKAIAQAGGIEFPAADLDRIVKSLNGLEETFRPLVQDLPPELEPAFDFRVEASGE